MLFGRERWKRIWEQQTKPLHHRDTEEFYRAFAAEIDMILGPLKKETVLEIGCGTGALFPYLSVRAAKRYVGVDISPAMLDEFRKRAEPNVELALASGDEFRDGRTYDLVFSVGVIQNFTASMFRDHMANAAAALNEGGHILCGQIPWKPLRRAYCDGSLMGRKDAGLWRYLKTRLALVRHGVMGRWYDGGEFAGAARRHGLDVQFFGSHHYPYRMHVLFTKPLAPK